MSLDSKLLDHLKRALATVDSHGTKGPRLLDDALRLVARTQQFIKQGLAQSTGLPFDALTLACYAIQLPLRDLRPLPTGKPARTGLRDRAELAAELLINLLEGKADAVLLDATTRILQELPQKTPVLDEAKLLADAINLDDFSLYGLFQQTTLLAQQGHGPVQFIDSLLKRDEYGYWDARLKDGFHFDAVRKLAQARLTQIRAFADHLKAELEQDKPRD